MVKARLTDPFYKYFIKKQGILKYGLFFGNGKIVYEDGSSSEVNKSNYRDLLNLDNLQGKDKDKKKIKQLKKLIYFMLGRILS